MLGRRPNSNQARISVLGFSTNRVWLVFNFYIITLLQMASVFSINDYDHAIMCVIVAEWSKAQVSGQ